MIEQALLERGLLGVIVLALGLAVRHLYNELQTQRSRQREEMNRLQVSFTDTSRDHHEQLIEAHKDFTNRLLSVVTSQAEMQEKISHSIVRMTDAFQQLERKIETSSDSRNKSNEDDARTERGNTSRDS